MFLLFLYGPTTTIGILSFQGPEGGLTFPMRGWSLHWFDQLFKEQAIGDIWGAWRRSIGLGLMVMVTNVTSPVLYALGTLTTKFSLCVILLFVIIVTVIQRRRARLGSDAGKGLV